jgi:hypothetical protein
MTPEQIGISAATLYLRLANEFKAKRGSVLEAHYQNRANHFFETVIDAMTHDEWDAFLLHINEARE